MDYFSDAGYSEVTVRSLPVGQKFTEETQRCTEGLIRILKDLIILSV
jgi:hypothetical protein